MKKALTQALTRYGRTIKRNGWQAGEPIIEKESKRFRDFRKWAMALGIMLRAQEILENGRVAK